jgi:hypothetical protein
VSCEWSRLLFVVLVVPFALFFAALWSFVNTDLLRSIPLTLLASHTPLTHRYAPRRPHTKGSRALTAMELDATPLVTGARDSVEHATSLSSPRRKPHPSWEPHVELEAHPTFGNKYHGHHLHVHHHHHGDEWKASC